MNTNYFERKNMGFLTILLAACALCASLLSTARAFVAPYAPAWRSNSRWRSFALSAAPDGDVGGEGMADGDQERDEKEDGADWLPGSAPPPARLDRVSEGLGRGVQPRAQRLRQYKEGLEIRWRMGQQQAAGSEAKACRRCSGSGFWECRFCSGTGFLRFNGEIVRSAGGAVSSCPICKARGEEACGRCHGTGSIAAWLVQP
ncbi:unnamed protein product [Phaeothamnion confervicola]